MTQPSDREFIDQLMPPGTFQYIAFGRANQLSDDQLRILHEPVLTEHKLPEARVLGGIEELWRRYRDLQERHRDLQERSDVTRIAELEHRIAEVQSQVAEKTAALRDLGTKALEAADG